MHTKYIFIIFTVICCICSNNLWAGIVIGHATQSDTSILDDNTKLQTISTLENDIAILQAELKKCEKSKKGWKVATIAGAIGAVATGVAAGVQASKIKKNKAEINELNTDISNKKAELGE